ncbi:MAG TPA: carboxymuconolactone decarboxylase [Chloroflexota bacterium]|nr:carboxymuconolactone decarboxylase [Chloroflexota bacterium]
MPDSRILEVPEDQYSPAQRAAIDALLQGRGRLLTPYKVWIHSPQLAMAMERLGTFLNKNCSLTQREVELGIVLTARHWAGEFVLEAHVKTCLELGYPPSVMEAIRRGDTPALDNARERSIYDLAIIAARPGPGQDDVFDTAVANLGREGVAEALALFGYYSAVAIAMKLHRVPVPARAGA